MMTPEQRQLAEQIADYVRREVREVGLLLERPDGSAGGAWRLAWVAQIGDGSTCTWISAEDDVSWEGSGEEPVEMALCVRVDGIPDLSDDATVDALIRHLHRRGWLVFRESKERRSLCFAAAIAAEADPEEANHETL